MEVWDQGILLIWRKRWACMLYLIGMHAIEPCNLPPCSQGSIPTFGVTADPATGLERTMTSAAAIVGNSPCNNRRIVVNW
jgi:hypothetical protein